MASIIKVDTLKDTSDNNVIVKSGTTITVGTSGDTVTIPSGATITNNGTATGFQTFYPPYRNLIINGDMSIAQRGTSTASITASGYYTVDRFDIGGTTFGTFTQSQDTDVPTGQGFSSSIKFLCTTANASLDASSFLQMHQSIEGQNLQYLKKGTSNAESTTLSFWVKSNKTGTYIVQLYDIDNTRMISKSYTINSANTWEKKTITYDGDTTGTLDNDNGRSLDLVFALCSGTNNSSGTLQTTWGTATSANRFVGQVNLADTINNYWQVTGVQLEAGTSASDFEFLPYDVNLQRCYRYFYNWISESNYQNICIGSAISTLNARGIFQLPIKMRTAPSGSANGNFRIVDMGTDVQKTGTGSMVSIARSSSHIVYMNFATNGSLTKGNNCEMGANNDVDAEILFDAEL